MTLLLLSCLVVMLASLAGVVSLWGVAGRYIERKLELLVSFSAGVFLIFAFQVGAEALEHGGGAPGFVWIVAGAVLALLLFRLLPQKHKHEHGHHGHQHLDARRLLLADGVHNMADGVFLAAAYAVSPALGLASTVGVLAHEALQELSEFFVLKDAGYSTRRALTLNFAVSSTILAGALGGYFLLEQFEMIEGPLLALVCGGILTVIFHDLLPHAAREARTARQYARHLLWFVLGAALMLLLTQLIPHAEPHADVAPAEGGLAQ